MKELLKEYLYFVKSFADVRDYALGDTSHRLRKDELAYFRNNPKERSVKRYPRDKQGITLQSKPYDVYRNPAISKPMLERHLLAVDGHKIYYGNRTNANLGLFMLDIDYKKQHEATANSTRDIARFISASVFDGRMYFEPSTNGKGVHGYVFFDLRFLKRELISELINALTRLIKARVMAWGEGKEIGGSFDVVRGQPNVWKQNESGEWYIASCFTEAKLPRLNAVDSFEESLKLLKKTWLGNLRELVDSLKLDSEGEKAGQEAASLRSSSQAKDTAKRLGKRKQKRRDNSIGAHDTKNITSDSRESSSKDAWERSLAASATLVRITQESDGRFPTLEELHEYYVGQGFATGEDDGRRLRRLSRALDHFVKTYDFEKRSSSYKCDKDTYLEVIDKVLPTPGHVASRYYDRIITREDLNWFIGLVVKICFESGDSIQKVKGRTSREQVITWFKYLKESGQHDKTCNSHKYRGMLQICIDAQLIAQEKEHIPPIFQTMSVGMTIKNRKVKGLGRLLAPGMALGSLRLEWERQQAARAFSGQAQVKAIA